MSRTEKVKKNYNFSKENDSSPGGEEFYFILISFVISGGGGLSGWQTVCGENENIDRGWGGGNFISI